MSDAYAGCRVPGEAVCRFVVRVCVCVGVSVCVSVCLGMPMRLVHLFNEVYMRYTYAAGRA